MTCKYDSGYSAAATYPMNHARVLHGGLWQSGGTITASATAAGYDADAPDAPETWQTWRPPAANATWSHDFGGAQTVDCASLVLREIGPGTLNIREFDGAAWNIVATADMSTLTNGAVMFLFDPVSTTAMRVQFVTEIATVCVAKFGQALEMPQPIYGDVNPPELNPVVVYSQQMSDGGEYLGRSEVRRGTSIDMTWRHVTRAWSKVEGSAFQENAAEGFFLAWNPLRSGAAEYASAGQRPEISPMGIRDFDTFSVKATGYGRD